MARHQIIKGFTDSAAGLLAALMAMLFVSNLATLSLPQPREPIVGVPVNLLFWLIGLGAGAVSLACIWLKAPRARLWLILWFAGNIILYRLALAWEGTPDIYGYVAALAKSFYLSNAGVIVLLNVCFCYLAVASGALLLWDVCGPPEILPLKTICAACGGHIAFAAQNIGMKIACPHCTGPVILRALDAQLKMSCYFCKGHIEFPAHALGTKMPCPHCQRDITLVEPK